MLKVNPVGVTNFFKLLESLDAHKINPLGGAMIQKNIASIDFPGLFEQMAPSFERYGVDVARFREKLFCRADELRKAWVNFITTEAEKILTRDFLALIELSKKMMDNRRITSTEVNTIIGFTIMYYDVIENRKINKKDVIEGVLLKGIIKKSSFYQKIAEAEQDNTGVLSWDEKDAMRDDIWQHLVLQNCRFLKQTIQKLSHYSQDADRLKAQLQEMIDQGEYEQFRSRGRSGIKLKYLVAFLLLLGSGVFLVQNMADPEGVETSNMAVVENPIASSPEVMEVQTVADAGGAVFVKDGAQRIQQTTASEGELLRYLQAVDQGQPVNMLAPPTFERAPGQQNVVHGQSGRHFVSEGK